MPEFNRFVRALEADPQAALGLPGLCEARSLSDESVLNFFAIENRVDVLRHLLPIWPDINRIAVYGRTALGDAVFAGAHDAALVLLEHGADPNLGAEEERPLDKAVWHRDEAAVDLLLRFKPDLTRPVYSDVSILEYARERGTPEIERKLSRAWQGL